MKPPVVGYSHMAVAGHYLASTAAHDVLAGGGNAADAGVAAGLVLGVVQSDYVNIAGVAPIMFREAATGKITTIDGVGRWPRGLDPQLFMREHGGHVPSGILRTVIPAAPAAWIEALIRFGTMTFADVAAAAIRHARDGFAMHPFMHRIITEHQDEYARWEANRSIYLPDGAPPPVGSRFVQSDLARTLQYMADEERSAANKGRDAGLSAAWRAFYQGDIAAAIVRYHAENGGLLTAADLAEHSVAVETGVQTAFAGGTLSVCGAWCQGPSLAQTMALIDTAALQGTRHNGVEHLHIVAEAIKLAFADRDRYFGDPDFVDVPLDRLLSVDYAAERRRQIGDRAAPDMPAPGDFGDDGFGTRRTSTTDPSAGAERWSHHGDTSYCCAVDAWGNAFSATPSDVSYNSPVIPGTGLCPSARGSASWADPQHPSGVWPGKRPRLTPNPAIFVDDAGRAMPFGTPGGDVQVQAMAQFLLNLKVFGMAPQEAAEAPRIASYSFPGTFEPHNSFPGRLCVEGRIDVAVRDALAARGHDVKAWPDHTHLAGAICAIVPTADGGLHAAADHRRPSGAVGW
ncbi:gamma-glutamyltransferase [Fodinicurvata sp. EGI_FJ10296]|uniref:gamma-glutamyltransferase family protein n=1 Tax=Fodinicurvata sp. EGI_FJ10296 TaxID=3231908 RepID=UPI003453F4FA